MKPLSTDRRRFLKNVSLGSGSLVLGPVLSQIEAQAEEKATKSPTRFVFVVESNGVPPADIQPSSLKMPPQGRASELTVTPLKEHELAKALEPVAAWKDRITIVQGLSGRVCGGGHSNNFGALGVYNAKGGVGNSGVPMGETIDYALGHRLGGIFELVAMGIQKNQNLGVIYNCSASAANKPFPTICDAMLGYSTLFGSVAEGVAKQKFIARNSVLDFLQEDLKRIEPAIGSAEREKFQQHLAAYEDLRKRQSRLNEIANTLRKQAPVVSDKYRSPVETDQLDSCFDLAAAALISGLTHVVTLSSAAGDPYFDITFKGLGIEYDKHKIGHGDGTSKMTASQMALVIRRFHFELIDRLMKKLNAIPEGNGTMLDNTLIVYLSDAAESHHSRCWEWPFVLIGNLGGRLKSGVHIQYPYWGKTGHRTIGNLYTTFLHAVGDSRKYFGVKDTNLKDFDLDGPLSELLA